MNYDLLGGIDVRENSLAVIVIDMGSWKNMGISNGFKSTKHIVA